ncbi:hypothetical protein IT415_02255 [bacterium]|nr:hypothetical protein [bacterium]
MSTYTEFNSTINFIDLPLEERIEVIIDEMSPVGFLALIEMLDGEADTNRIARAMFELGIKLGFLAGHEDGHACADLSADPEPVGPTPGYL